MSKHVVLVSIPGLRNSDVGKMPSLLKLREQGGMATLTPSFPCVTCPVQANLTTGVGPEQHGVVANGFFYRDKGEFEMWTAWNEAIKAPQIWDVLHQHDSSLHFRRLVPHAEQRGWLPITSAHLHQYP